jgi:hypothetical protein
MVTSRQAERLYEVYKDMSGNVEYRGVGGKAYFFDMLFDSIMLVEYPFGIVRFSDYVPMESVRVHALFRSKDVFRNIDTLRLLAKMVFSALYIKRIEAHIPSDKRALKRMLSQVGFKRTSLLSGGKGGNIEVWTLRRNSNG